MEIRFYNTLTHRLETFAPIDPPNVYMYNCGPTVYDFSHIGNFKTLLFADVLRRFLELAGYTVHQVMNITDVGHMTEDELADGGGEDKMQVAMQRIKDAKKAGTVPNDAVSDPSDPYQVAQFYIDAFLDDARVLGLKVAGQYPQHMPRATQHITQMQQDIKRLIEADHAYVASDSAVYYRVESFPEYGKLSGNTLDKLRSGAGGRIVDANQAVKCHPADFLLWKPDKSHIMKWDSPWGVGYPGWHIECSSMARSVLGRDVIDIHSGGEDNIFPHHECEIAQACGVTGNDLFARFWLHSRHLLVEGEKMSKSKGTFYTIRDVLEGKITGSPVDPSVLRLALMSTHYRSNLNFTEQRIKDAASAISRLHNLWLDVRERGEGRFDECTVSHPVIADFKKMLADDLNISGALSVLFKWVGSDHPNADESVKVLEAIDSVLGIGLSNALVRDAKSAMFGDCQEIDAARANKDYAAADAIRQRLIDAGYDVKTTKDGTVATKRLA